MMQEGLRLHTSAVSEMTKRLAAPRVTRGDSLLAAARLLSLHQVCQRRRALVWELMDSLY